MGKLKVALVSAAIVMSVVALVAAAGIPRFPLTSSTSGNGLNGGDGGDGGGDGGDDGDDHEGGKDADFSLFTTEATELAADDFVTCAGSGLFTIHIAVTNFDMDEIRLNIVFVDKDLVTYFVPSGTSFSLVQVGGTNPGIDDVIKVDPQDQDQDANPMVGWVSAIASNSGEVSCTVTTF